MNSDVFILEPTPAPFLFALARQSPREEEAPGARSFSTVGTGGVRAAGGRIGNGTGLATPVLEWLSSALENVGSRNWLSGEMSPRSRGRQGSRA